MVYLMLTKKPKIESLPFSVLLMQTGLYTLCTTLVNSTKQDSSWKQGLEPIAISPPGVLSLSCQLTQR